jgi:hypothetical protein
LPYRLGVVLAWPLSAVVKQSRANNQRIIVPMDQRVFL